MSGPTPNKRPFLPTGRRGWLAAVGIVVFGAGVASVATWAQAHFGATFAFVMMLAALLIEPWAHERYGRRRGGRGGHALLQGRMGIVTEACSPVGRVRVDGTLWTAKSTGGEELQAGECVYVHDGEGLLLHVSRAEPQP